MFRKVVEAIVVFWQAARYSFGFCWRNSKGPTIGRLVTSMLNTASLYFIFATIGWTINVAQRVGIQLQGSSKPFWDIFQTDLLYPLLCLTAVFMASVSLTQYNAYLGSCWRIALRFGNQREMNDHRATLDVACFKSKTYDDLTRRIDDLPNSWHTRIAFANEMFDLFATLVSFVLFGVSLLWYQPPTGWAYAGVLLFTAVPMAFFQFNLVSKWWDLFYELLPTNKKRNVLEKPYHFAIAFVQAITFNQMPALRKQIDINVRGVMGRYDEVRRVSLQRGLITRNLAVVGLGMVIAHAFWSTVVSGSGIGTLTVVIAAARTFQNNLDAIVFMIAEQWNNARGVILIEKDFLGLKPLIKTPYPVIPPRDITPLVRFQNVSFRYPETDIEVLHDVSFDLLPGSKVAIVGKSGNGKSTIQALLMRYYDPTLGKIWVNDIDLRHIRPEEWSKVISALTQEYTVIERPIAEEIASSRLDQPLDLERVMTSSRFASFEEVVKDHPDGYNAQIGVEFGGREFSGGEKQRLALARVHYRGTPILVLDEPDARLDPDSARRVIDQLFSLQGVTVVLITHHVSRAERCDNIIVMGKGSIVEQGTHAELMAQNGVYTSMFHQDRERLGKISVGS